MNKINNQEFLKFLEELKVFYSSSRQILNGEFYSFSSDYQVVWRHNNTRLLQFSSNNIQSYNKISPILFIPSLINHGYILDIMPEYSLVKILSKQFSCYFIDWGEPTLEEANYSFEDYYVNKVTKILNFIYKKHKQRIDLIGYCLGGIISLLSAMFDAHIVNKLVLLACPWDFSCYKSRVLFFKTFIDQVIKTRKFISSHFIRNFFMYFMPIEKFYNKFVVFGSLKLDDPRRALFLRVEKWSLHNLFISNSIVKEIINNMVLNGNDWTICKKSINLQAIKNKCFVVSGKSDVVVPYISTKPLIKQLTNCHTVLLSSGHTGIIISREAKKWQYQLVNWLNSKE